MLEKRLQQVYGWSGSIGSLRHFLNILVQNLIAALLSVTWLILYYPEAFS